MSARSRIVSTVVVSAAVCVAAGVLVEDGPHRAALLGGSVPPAATVPAPASTAGRSPSPAPAATSTPTPTLTPATALPAATLSARPTPTHPVGPRAVPQQPARPTPARTTVPSPAAPSTRTTPHPPAPKQHLPAQPTPSGPVLWNGDFETGGVPHGATGRRCHTGAADGPDSRSDQYSSTQEMGNTACTSRVVLTGERTRTPRSKRALRITMGPHQQRELLVSKFGWRPDARGSVDLWYGLSLYYDPFTWQQGAGYRRELSASSWDDPFGLRTKGPNGSLNGSSDLRRDGPHLSLRRNTVRNLQHFYGDGRGLDEIDLGRVVVGRWMDLVVHVRWSTTSHNALREAWRDGVYQGRRTSRNAVDTLPHHLRVGQYQDTTIGHSRTTYVDNVRIGTSYAAVDPSR